MSEIKVLTSENLEEIYSFEMKRMPGEGIEKEMSSWHMPWRREALEHYLPLGWSFIKKNGDKLQGYILCQPVLFFNSWTQTLWIEHVGAVDEETGREMIEIAYRWARDKHLQKVFLRRELPYIDMIDFAPLVEEGALYSLKTTKL